MIDRYIEIGEFLFQFFLVVVNNATTTNTQEKAEE